nr:unnamed protein product [Digitaria exilis]
MNASHAENGQQYHLMLFPSLPSPPHEQASSNSSSLLAPPFSTTAPSGRQERVVEPSCTAMATAKTSSKPTLGEETPRMPSADADKRGAVYNADADRNRNFAVDDVDDDHAALPRTTTSTPTTSRNSTRREDGNAEDDEPSSCHGCRPQAEPRVANRDAVELKPNLLPSLPRLDLQQAHGEPSSPTFPFSSATSLRTPSPPIPSVRPSSPPSLHAHLA